MNDVDNVKIMNDEDDVKIMYDKDDEDVKIMHDCEWIKLSITVYIVFYESYLSFVEMPTCDGGMLTFPPLYELWSLQLDPIRSASMILDTNVNKFCDGDNRRYKIVGRLDNKKGRENNWRLDHSSGDVYWQCFA